jgi:condensin complex subunit 2
VDSVATETGKLLSGLAGGSGGGGDEDDEEGAEGEEGEDGEGGVVKTRKVGTSYTTRSPSTAKHPLLLLVPLAAFCSESVGLGIL